jgi:hypothetical protein
VGVNFRNVVKNAIATTKARKVVQSGQAIFIRTIRASGCWQRRLTCRRYSSGSAKAELAKCS